MNKQCARKLSENVQCDGIVASSLTGEFCTKCYFELKRLSNAPTTPSLGKALSNLPESKLPIPKADTPDLTTDTIKVLEGEIKEIIIKQGNDSFFKCKDCNELHPIKETDKNDRTCLVNHAPVKTATNQIKDPTKKYCQSCLERGYGLNLATREWTKDYFICDACFEPLLNNLVNHDTTRAEIERIKTDIKVDSPFIKQFYELLNIPPHLQYVKSDDVLRHRNEIFNYHAPALVNMSLEEIQEKIENYQIMLFQIKVGLEPLADYINKVKHEERTKANIEGIKKSKDSVAKTSKSKMSKEEKEAKALGMTLEKYQEMVKKAKLREFEKLTGTEMNTCKTCGTSFPNNETCPKCKAA